MTIVRVKIAENDRNISAMVKALAWGTAGRKAVKGATKEFLNTNGYLEFPFKHSFRATEFCQTVAKYLPGRYATAETAT
jgi:hypothetical protein